MNKGNTYRRGDFRRGGCSLRHMGIVRTALGGLSYPAPGTDFIFERTSGIRSKTIPGILYVVCIQAILYMANTMSGSTLLLTIDVLT